LDLQESYDDLTDRVSITDAVKLAAYMPPSGFGVYVGFAPVEEE
jgi:hypothetical protein